MDLDDEELEATKKLNGVYKQKDKIWTMKSGKKINVKDMSTQHIINTLRCIENGRINFIINMGWAVDNDYQEFDEDIETKKEWIRIFKNELEKRGSLDE